MEPLNCVTLSTIIADWSRFPYNLTPPAVSRLSDNWTGLVACQYVPININIDITGLVSFSDADWGMLGEDSDLEVDDYDEADKMEGQWTVDADVRDNVDQDWDEHITLSISKVSGIREKSKVQELPIII